MFQDELPKRVRVLVLGGGIHGVGVLHDMASRGWRDVHLVEKATLGAGTSSRSTKLIHGGLRYLKQLDFGLVAEALRERRRLMDLAPDLVKPVEMLLPILKKGGMPRMMVKVGLALYDRLSGRFRIKGHHYLNEDEIAAKAPMLDKAKIKGAYSFWDAQTDDEGLVRRVATSAVKLGATITENCAAIKISPSDDGWDVEVATANGERHIISALYVINCLGPWANKLLEDSAIKPTHRAINNKGIHLLCEEIGLKVGLFLQSPEDDRIFFVLPWQSYTLVGTTEDLFSGDPDTADVTEAEVEYLLERCNRYLVPPLSRKQILRVFAGLRWLAVEDGSNLTETSRAYIVGEKAGKRGLLMTIYGGKLTTYRRLAATIGDRIALHFGEFRASRTGELENWAQPADEAQQFRPILDRFQNHR